MSHIFQLLMLNLAGLTRDAGAELSLILDVVGTPMMDDFQEITSSRSK